MTDEILDDLFHGSALHAFLEQARRQQSWPDSEATRKRAYQLYEQALAEKNQSVCESPPPIETHKHFDFPEHPD